MKLHRILLAAIMAASLVSCGRMDPQSVPDPVSESIPKIIVISVGSRPGTKVNVNIVDNGSGKEGVVTFTENDRLFLSEKIDPYTGEAVDNYYWSYKVVVSEDGKSADFSFAINVDSKYNDETVESITYLAAYGDWSKQGGGLYVNIPTSIDLSKETGSVLPQDGVIAVSDPIICKPSRIEEALGGNIKLHHMVSYGVLNVQSSQLVGKTITGITVEGYNSSSIAGEAQLVSSTHTDSSSGQFQLSFNSSSASKISIMPSAEIMADISGNLGTNIWFPTLPNIISSESLQISLTDAEGRTYSGSLSTRTSPDMPVVEPPQGGAARMGVTNLTTE